MNSGNEGRVIHVAINPHSASKRTRNRVKEAGPAFTLVKVGMPASIREDAVLLRSITTGWFGWLPAGEIKIKEIIDNG